MNKYNHFDAVLYIDFGEYSGTLNKQQINSNEHEIINIKKCVKS